LMNLLRNNVAPVAELAVGAMLLGCSASGSGSGGSSDLTAPRNWFSAPDPRPQLLTAGEVVDTSLRGPTGGSTPLDFEYDADIAAAYIQRHRAGGHLSTPELLYLLQAYEQEYRQQIKNPRGPYSPVRQLQDSGAVSPALHSAAEETPLFKAAGI